MKRSIFYPLACCVLIFSFATGTFTTAAQSPYRSYLPVILSTLGNRDNNFGFPGLSFRYVSTLGVTDEPYPPDTQHLYRPQGLLIDSSDNLYTVEEYGQRLLGFDAAGENIIAIGHAGMALPSEGYLSDPGDAAKDASQNLWVVMDHAVKAFDPLGNQLLAFPADGQAGSDNSHFNHPVGIAFDQQGFLFISDANNHRVQVYSISDDVLSYVNTIGVTGEPLTDNDHFNTPGRIAFDSANALYVTDTGNSRVQKCTSANNWASWTCNKFFGGTTGSDPASGQLSNSSAGIAIDSSNNVFIADGGNFRVLKCTPGGQCAHFAGAVGEKGSDNSHFDWVPDVAVDSTGKVYVADKDNMRIQVFTPAGGYEKTIGLTRAPYAVDAAHYNQPWGIATAAGGGYYILENSGHRLIKVNSDGGQAWTTGIAGVYGAGNDAFGPSAWWGESANPVETQDGKVYVPDYGNHRIQIFDANSGSYLATFGQYGQNDLSFNLPTSIAINPTNQDILVADQANHRVQVFTSDWVYKTTIGVTGVPGSDNYHFNHPKSVRVDGSGIVFVADSENHRVQRCAIITGTRYSCSTFLGPAGLADPDFSNIHPLSLALDTDGRLYVASDSHDNVQVYDANGSYLTSIGGMWGSASGRIKYPAGVAVDGAGNVYITDGIGHTVKKYAPGVPNWRQMNINGFGELSNRGVTSLEVFNGAVYAGTANLDKGGRIYRATNGADWTPVSSFGLSSAYTATNPVILDLIEFKGSLFAGVGWDKKPGQIWSSADGLSWNPVVSDGFGHAANTGITSFGIFDDRLYAGTSSGSIWRSDTGSPLSWTPVVTDSLGYTQTKAVTSFVEFNHEFFASVESSQYLSGKAYVWHTSDGVRWSPAADPGFGEAGNDSTGGLAVFNGFLYLGTQNRAGGAQLWRTEDGVKWEKIIGDGFGDAANYKIEGFLVYGSKMLAFVDNDQTGLQVMLSADGESWNAINLPGFGDSNNNATLWSHAITVFNNKLLVGTWNNTSASANGGEIWTYEPAISASFSAQPTSGIAPFSVDFTSLITGTPTSILWDFGDGAASTISNTQHIYQIAGVYTVTLTVDSFGSRAINSKSNLITVMAPYSPIFSASPTTGRAPLAVKFSNLSTGNFTACLWNFGDGQTSNLCDPPFHYYSYQGIYTVKLTIRGANGSVTETKTGYITVSGQNIFLPVVSR